MKIKISKNKINDTRKITKFSPAQIAVPMNEGKSFFFPLKPNSYVHEKMLLFIAFIW